MAFGVAFRPIATTRLNNFPLGKRRSENQIIGESGIDILRSLFPKEWVIREYTADYGIDLDVELFEECNDGVYVTKGEHVLFQVKTSLPITKIICVHIITSHIQNLLLYYHKK